MSEVEIPEQAASPSQPPPTASPRPKRGLYEFQSLAMTVVIAVFVITFVLQAFQIPSESMEKTLLVGDYLLVDKAHYGQSSIWNRLMPYRPIQRQDIIVFRYPINPHQHFVKRVIAIPGDRVRLKDKQVYVNGVRQDDSYATFIAGWPDPYRDNFPAVHYEGGGIPDSPKWYREAERLIDNNQLIVPENSYFVMGDNRDDSLDSRYWGFVKRDQITARPLVIYFSLRRPSRTDLAQVSDDRLGHDSDLSTQVKGFARWKRIFHVVH